MSHPVIQSVLEQRLKTWCDDRSLPVVFENTSFKRPSVELPEDYAYLRTFYLKVPTTSLDLAGDHRGYRAIFQISVITRRGIGRGSAGAIATQLADLFQLNLILVATTGLEIQIVKPFSEATGIEGDIDYTLPTSVEVRADSL